MDRAKPRTTIPIHSPRFRLYTGNVMALIPGDSGESVLAAFKSQVETLYGPRLKCLYLFGSRARQTNSPDSDIDVALIIEGPIDVYCEIQRTSEIRAAINLDSGHSVSCVYLTPSDLASKRSPLARNIAREGKRI
jgi:uncharacterized protein